LHVCKHLAACFAVMGVPEQIKTDNGPAYAGEVARKYMQMWAIRHNAGIPHSPTGQAIIERTHRL
ncbi:POK18 protein, partial [Probosciger aterrimus]|nr:POK18 protein [Probosciger aterrimus]